MSTTGKLLIAERLATLADDMREIAELMRQHPDAEFHRHIRDIGIAAHVADQWAKELERFA